jgi:hypothetical protein
MSINNVNARLIDKTNYLPQKCKQFPRSQNQFLTELLFFIVIIFDATLTR